MTCDLRRKKGQPVPVTVVEAGPCSVVAVKEDAADGYTAPDSSLGTSPPKLNRPDRRLRRRRVSSPRGGSMSSGWKTPRLRRQVVPSNFLRPATWWMLPITRVRDLVIKRHHFEAGRQVTASKFHREPGSAGGSSGLYLHGDAGKDGGERVTVNLSIAGVDPEITFVDQGAFQDQGTGS